MRAAFGNNQELSDTEGGSGMRCLFCLTASLPEIWLPGVRVKWWVKRLILGGVWRVPLLSLKI